MARRLSSKRLSSQRTRLAEEKIERIQHGGRVRTLDLFSGCGGLSLGFHAAGFDIVAAVDNDPLAAASHALNFYGQDLANVKLHGNARDLTKTSPQSLLRELKIGDSVDRSVDVIIGGPPCQAFARVGRAKLREVDQHPEAFLLDRRADLYLQYLEYVRAMCPLAIVVENVPDALNHGGHNIAEEICEVLDDEGYICGYTTLNAAFFGVPQMRDRMFLLAYRRELDAAVKFPEPTHFVELPSGYHSTRAVALKPLRARDTSANGSAGMADRFFVDPPAPHSGLPEAIKAREAVEDLPALKGTSVRGARRFNTPLPYRNVAKINRYVQLMRNWPGFEARDAVYDHVIRSLPRDYQIFERMKPGDQYPQAYATAERLFANRLRALERAGKRIRPGTDEYLRLRKSIVPPYDPGKFPNKWRKMEADLPARTLLAHLGKDSYSHIHYDSEQARTISVREAARLQSFPDGFRFEGTMNPAFRQIGNAVPPLLANAIAHVILDALGVSAIRPPLVRQLY